MLYSLLLIPSVSLNGAIVVDISDVPVSFEEVGQHSLSVKGTGDNPAIDPKLDTAIFFDEIVKLPGKKCKIVGFGKNSFYGCDIKRIVVPTSIVFLEENAFRNSGLQMITLPQATTTLGPNCFRNCSDLIQVDISKAQVTKIPNSCFRDCSALTDIRLPLNITIIGKSSFGSTAVNILAFKNLAEIQKKAFFNCEYLMRIDLNGCNLKAFPAGCFWNCSKLYKIDFLPTIEEIGNFAFSNTPLVNVSLPPSVSILGEGCFSYSKLVSINLSETTISSIPSEAFFQCKKLANISLPDSVKKFGIRSFSYTSISNIPIPDSLDTIGAYCFDHCYKLKSVNLSNTTVTKLGDETFSNCVSLFNVVLPKCCAYLGNGVFNNTDIVKLDIGKEVHFRMESLTGTRRLTEVNVDPENPYVYQHGPGLFSTENNSLIFVVPLNRTNNYLVPFKTRRIEKRAFFAVITNKVVIANSVIEICPEAFSGSHVCEVVFPPSVQVLGARAFYECDRLASVELSRSSITSISEECFLRCRSLTKVELPARLESIEDAAFEGTAIKYIEIPIFTFSIQFNAFSSTPLKFVNISKHNRNYRMGDYEVTSADRGTLLHFQDINDTLKEYEVKEGIHTIGDNCFLNSRLERITLPLTLLAVRSHAFHGSKVGALVFPESTTILSDSALAFTMLRVVDLSMTKLTEFPPSLFKGSLRLQAVLLPETIKEFNDGCFNMTNRVKLYFLHQSCTNFELNGNLEKLSVIVSKNYKCNYAAGKPAKSTDQSRTDVIKLYSTWID